MAFRDPPDYKNETSSPCPHCGGQIGDTIAAVVTLQTAGLETRLARCEELLKQAAQFIEGGGVFDGEEVDKYFRRES